jgi:uncharacterized membrane protein
MMSSTLITVLLWVVALGSGLMAGAYFAFSGFIMQAFGKIETTQSITAMNAINKVILRSWFMPVFFGSSIVSVLLIIVALVHWSEAGSGWALLTGAVYFVGMFMCTVVFNVPLNNMLAESDEAGAGAREDWSHYLKTWTRWNHLRTVSSLVTCALGVWLLSSR